jgi:hypothetical protein
VGAAAFDFPYQPMHSVLRVYLDKQVDMIGHHFQFDDFASPRRRSFENQGFETPIDGLYQNRSPVFRTPNNVIFARINHVIVALVVHPSAYIGCINLMQGKSFRPEPETQRRRVESVPGRTGLWQVDALIKPSIKAYFAFDFYYVEHWSLWLDMKILLKTFAVVFSGTGLGAETRSSKRAVASFCAALTKAARGYEIRLFQIAARSRERRGTRTTIAGKNNHWETEMYYSGNGSVES